jgi:hypothetical protein
MTVSYEFLSKMLVALGKDCDPQALAFNLVGLCLALLSKFRQMEMITQHKVRRSPDLLGIKMSIDFLKDLESYFNLYKSLK